MKKNYLLIVISLLPILLSANYVKNGNTVIDTNTNLQWQDNSDTINKGFRWKEAIEYCEDLKLDGYDDWRLPNIRELNSIVNLNKIDPAIVNGFANVSNNWYWTSTSSGFSTAYGLSFSTGKFHWNMSKYDQLNVRCVRSR